jgi:NitT/TauT family transport system substrate-binding protein
MLVMTTAIQAAAAGAGIKIFAGMEAIADNVLSNLIITNRPHIQSISDLAREGGTLAVVRLSALVKWMIEYDLRKKGESVDKLTYIQVPFTEMGDQLRAGRVDAVLSAAGYFEPLLAEGYKVIFKYPQEALVSSGAKLPLSFALFSSSATFANNNQNVIESFQEAIDQAAKWIEANNDEARNIYADWIGANHDAVKNATVSFYKADVTASDVAGWLPVLTEGKLLKRGIDPDLLIPAAFGGK